MNGGAGEPFFSPEGVRDLHQMVIYYHGEVVGGHSIRLEEDLVIDTVGGKAHFSPDEIGEMDLFAGHELDAYDIGGTGVQQPFDLISGQAEGVLHFCAKDVVVLGGGIFSSPVVGAHFLQFFRSVESIIGMALADQLLSILLIESFRLALALTIGAIGAGKKRTFVGVESAPGEAIEDIFFCAGYIAGLVGVFDTKDEIALVLAGEKIVVKDCPYSSQVKASGGAGGKPKPDFFAHRAQR
jgi:hypothetical protein